MSSPPVGPVTGVPPVNAAGAAVRLEIVVATEAVLEGMLEGATPEASTKAGASADASAIAANPPAPATPPNPVAQAVDAARASAAQRQGSLAPLFADLAQVVNAPDLPPVLRAAIVQVLALQTPLSGPLTAETVRQAVTQSGLFLEAHLAQTTPAAPAAPDLKAALLTLQTALAAIPTPKPPAPAPTLGPPAAAAPTPTPGAEPASPAAPAAPPTPATPSSITASSSPPPPVAAATDPKAALLSLQMAPATETTGEAPPAATAGAAPVGPQTPPVGKAAVLPTAPGALAVQVDAEPLATPPARHAAAGYRSDPPDAPPAPAASRSDRPPLQAAPPDPAADLPPPPPHRAAALAAQPALPASLPVDAKTPEIVGRLHEAVDQAVARQTLHQVASLPDGQTSAWMFELPIATPQGTSIAQFEIQRDGRGQHGGEDAPDGWRLRFSIDVEPLGPVHIHLGLNGDHAQVVVWAEREASLEWLQSGAADLAYALPAEVIFHPGAPRRPTPAPGQFVDQAL